MNRRLFLTTLPLLAGAVLLSGCRNKDPFVTVANVGQEERISVGKPAGTGAVKSLRLKLEGRLDGTAQLVVLMEGQPYHVFNLEGTVDLEWKDAWPHDRARLLYSPGTARNGGLRITYRFAD